MKGTYVFVAALSFIVALTNAFAGDWSDAATFLALSLTWLTVYAKQVVIEQQRDTLTYARERTLGRWIA